jgi:hypothetical protein
MTDKSDTKAAYPAADSHKLTGLFDEMQALLAVMPGAAFAIDAPLPTEEETEAMFDNMPV